MKAWKRSYLTIRAKIENAGRDQRWEFDRVRLFQRTDYMASICQDLYDVAKVRKTDDIMTKVLVFLKGEGSPNLCTFFFLPSPLKRKYLPNFLPLLKYLLNFEHSVTAKIKREK